MKSELPISPKHSMVPFGVGQTKPHHFLDIFKTVWENKDELPFAYRILRDGVCDGCALGTSGMKDQTLSGTHLCNVRLALLRLNTMPALDSKHFESHAELANKKEKELRDLGRLAFPMLREKGSSSFQRISWEEAIAKVAEKIVQTTPSRLALYLTSRGITNEVYYVAQKFARFLGTNNIDNAARLCHSPSSVGLKTTLGVAASTCSYKDWLGTDLLVFIGSNSPNNQPVTTKYIHHAKKKGTKVVVLNTFREPGMERYWIPSVWDSALFGTSLADEFFSVSSGGDLAFLSGTLKYLLEKKHLDVDFIEKHTTGFPQIQERLASIPWEELESSSGSKREEMVRFARMVRDAKTAIFVWSMGITQHAHGVENVQSIVNLALSQGMIGKPFCGLMPIRGHSGVQGGAEMGAVPDSFPGGMAVSDENADKLEPFWGFRPPVDPGLSTVDMVDACWSREIDVLYSVGGNFLETLPEPAYVREALQRVPFRIHQDIVLNPQMFVESEGDVLLLPSKTRYEQDGGGTETSTERMVYFSPEIEGRRIGESKTEWMIFQEIARQVDPVRYDFVYYESSAQIRQEISEIIPFYKGIETLEKKGDLFQYGGRLLCENGNFPTSDGKAHFTNLQLPEQTLPSGHFFLGNRRGKQFNTMILEKVDPLTGAPRNAIFIHPEDASALQLVEHQEVELHSEAGSFKGILRFSAIQRRNLQVFWPEGNVLLRRGKEPKSGIPLYTTTVQIKK